MSIYYMFAKKIKFHLNVHSIIEQILKFIGSTLSTTQKLVKEIKSVEKVKEIIKKWQIDIKEEPFRIKA
jgi:hypothetical protein